MELQGIEFVEIRPGSFMMGSDFNVLFDIFCESMAIGEEWEREVEAEWPQHQVTLSKGFYISRFPVTRKQFAELMQIECEPEIENRPARLTWQQVELYLQTLNAAGRGRDFHFRLPTEAEWEYCSKTGRNYEFLFNNNLKRNAKLIVTGDDFCEPDDDCDYESDEDDNDCETGEECREVGSSGKNSWGIYDMLGNIPEWCSDYFDADYFFESPSVDPENSKVGEFRVMKGSPASWYLDYTVPYRSSARIPLGFAAVDDEDDDEENRSAGLRLVAVRKEEAGQ